MVGAETRATGPTPELARLMRSATYASVATAGLLIVVKFAAWLFTDSIAMLSTLVDSLLDLAASLVNLFALRHALTPPDREHRFGHGKAEPLAALGQSTFIAGSAVFLIVQAGYRLYHPVPVVNGEAGIAVMLFAIVATFALTRYQAYVVRKTGSLVVQADSLHYVGDLLTNVSVIVALLLAAQLGWTLADPLFGLAIAIFIVFNAWLIAKGALDMLMDRELPDGDRQRIKEIVSRHPGVIDLHDLRTRASGPMVFIQLHLEMDGRMSLLDAHAVSDAVEAEVQAAFPGAEVLIHQDPYGVDEGRSNVSRRAQPAKPLT
jgi:ferrous-iron efflux pump FieF